MASQHIAPHVRLSPWRVFAFKAAVGVVAFANSIGCRIDCVKASKVLTKFLRGGAIMTVGPQ